MKLQSPAVLFMVSGALAAPFPNGTQPTPVPLPTSLPWFGPVGLIATAPEEAELSRECPAGQAFVECGSACPPRCFAPAAQFCTLQCVIGCQCKPGLLLNAAGNCVTPFGCLLDLFPKRNP